MLRTSLRKHKQTDDTPENKFLSSNAQDFIEEKASSPNTLVICRFLSSNAQDFIEEPVGPADSM